MDDLKGISQFDQIKPGDPKSPIRRSKSRSISILSSLITLLMLICFGVFSVAKISNFVEVRADKHEAPGLGIKQDFMGVLIGNSRLSAEKTLEDKGADCRRGTRTMFGKVANENYSYCYFDRDGKHESIETATGNVLIIATLHDVVESIEFRFKTLDASKTVQKIVESYRVKLRPSSGTQTGDYPFGFYTGTLNSGLSIGLAMTLSEDRDAVKIADGTLTISGIPYEKRPKIDVEEPKF